MNLYIYRCSQSVSQSVTYYTLKRNEHGSVTSTQLVLRLNSPRRGKRARKNGSLILETGTRQSMTSHGDTPAGNHFAASYAGVTPTSGGGPASNEGESAPQSWLCGCALWCP